MWTRRRLLTRALPAAAVAVVAAPVIARAVVDYVPDAAAPEVRQREWQVLVDTRMLPRGQGAMFNEPYIGSLSAYDIGDEEGLWNDYGYGTRADMQTMRLQVGDFEEVAGKLMGNAVEYRRDQRLTSTARINKALRAYGQSVTDVRDHDRELRRLIGASDRVRGRPTPARRRELKAWYKQWLEQKEAA